MNLVQVVSAMGAPLAPCHPARARELLRRGKAVQKRGPQGFYIQLTEESATSSDMNPSEVLHD